MALNNLQRIFYQNLAEKRLLGHEGQAFEDFFVDVARLHWGSKGSPDERSEIRGSYPINADSRMSLRSCGLRAGAAS